MIFDEDKSVLHIRINIDVISLPQGFLGGRRRI
jgi:hypothetical protein